MLLDVYACVEYMNESTVTHRVRSCIYKRYQHFMSGSLTNTAAKIQQIEKSSLSARTHTHLSVCFWQKNILSHHSFKSIAPFFSNSHTLFLSHKY